MRTENTTVSSKQRIITVTGTFQLARNDTLATADRPGGSVTDNYTSARDLPAIGGTGISYHCDIALDTAGRD